MKPDVIQQNLFGFGWENEIGWLFSVQARSQDFVCVWGGGGWGGRGGECVWVVKMQTCRGGEVRGHTPSWKF